MIETLCRSGASLDTVKLLLDSQQESYSDQNVNWRKAARELAICLCVKRELGGRPELVGDYRRRGSFFDDWRAMLDALSPAPQELIQNLLEFHQHFFPNHELNLQEVCEELVQPLKGWWRPIETFCCSRSFRFFVKCSIAERLDAVGVRKWRMDVKDVVERLLTVNGDHFETHLDTIYSKLETCEHKYHRLKDAAFLLELVLWKSKIDELDADTAELRGQCRINCGAAAVIPNVLPYLISYGEEEGNGNDEADSMDKSSNGGEDSSNEEGDSSDEDGMEESSIY